MALCPYCKRKLRNIERYCRFCEQDVSKIKDEEEKPNCFIATAAYGTPYAKEIDVLRAFRDSIVKNYMGRIFVRAYYRISPPIAGFIKKHNFAKKAVRGALKPVIFILRKR